MTWTKEDTEALRVDMVCRHCGTSRADAEAAPHASCNHPRFVNAASALECRAADEIERLQARVAELEAAVAFQQERVRDEARAKVARWLHAIPRAALVSALRERAAAWERRALAALTSPQASAEERLMDHKVLIVQRVECLTLADEIERGEWPQPRDSFESEKLTTGEFNEP